MTNKMILLLTQTIHGKRVMKLIYEIKIHGKPKSQYYSKECEG
jgi:hypothetical protein